MKHLLTAILTLYILFSIGACTKEVYVPIETFKRDSIEIRTHRIDTLRMYDSIYVEKNGDTVSKYVYKVIYRNTLKTDTFYKERTDTIRVPYPVEVEKKEGFFAKVMSKFEWVMTAVLVLGLIFVSYKTFKR